MLHSFFPQIVTPGHLAAESPLPAFSSHCPRPSSVTNFWPPPSTRDDDVSLVTPGCVRSQAEGHRRGTLSVPCCILVDSCTWMVPETLSLKEATARLRGHLVPCHILWHLLTHSCGFS